jgi:DNA-binding MarR family transcriptional regulator
MSASLLEEIKQGKPFRSAKEEAWLNLARSAAVLQHELEQTLRPYGISPTQYNVLRILRGARCSSLTEGGDTGLGQGEIRNRLVAQVPDVPRILERMERSGWITRARGVADRRTTFAAVTVAGMELLERMDCIIEAWLNGKFREIPCTELDRFNELLARARA